MERDAPLLRGPALQLRPLPDHLRPHGGRTAPFPRLLGPLADLVAFLLIHAASIARIPRRSYQSDG